METKISKVDPKNENFLLFPINIYFPIFKQKYFKYFPWKLLPQFLINYKTSEKFKKKNLIKKRKNNEKW